MLISCTDIKFLFDLPVFPLIPAVLSPEVSHNMIFVLDMFRKWMNARYSYVNMLYSPLKQGN